MSADSADLSILDQRPVDLELDLPIEQATNGMLQIQVPPKIKIILKDMSRAVLKGQPKDQKGILLFLAQYLTTMLTLRDTTGQDPFEVHDLIDEFDEDDVYEGGNVKFADSDQL